MGNTLTSTPHGWVPGDTFGHRAAIIMAKMGWNFRQAAEATGAATENSWRGWVRKGRRPQDYEEVCRRIAVASGCDLTWLMQGGPLAQSGVRDCTDTDHLADVSWRPDDGPDQLHLPGIDDVVIDLRDRPALAVAASQ